LRSAGPPSKIAAMSGMARMSRAKLSIDIEGASEEEIRRGIAAAHRVFALADVMPSAAATAHFNREGLDIAGVFAWEHAIACLKEGGADAATVAAEEAELARFQKEEDLPDLTDREWELAHLWDEADVAAAKACCAGWANAPVRAYLSLSPEPDAVDR
jgi:hypothetical protein